MTLVETQITPPPQAAPERDGRDIGQIPNGEAAAAFLAAGIGSTALGLLIILAEAFTGIKTMLTLNAGVGPLSGKTIGAIVIWLVAWGVLHFLWKGKELDFGKVFRATLVLIACGFVGTFPLIYQPLAKLLGGG